MKTLASLALGVAIGAAGISAVAYGQGSTTGMAGPETDAGAASKAYQEAMDRMHQAMVAYEMTGDADADFVNLMIPHHQAALDMAKAAQHAVTDPEIKQLVDSIAVTQEKELARFQAWRAERSKQGTP